MNDEIEITPDAPRRGRPPKVANEEPAAVDTVTVTVVKGHVPRDAKPDADGVYPKRLPGQEVEISTRDALYLCSRGIVKMDMPNV